VVTNTQTHTHTRAETQVILLQNKERNIHTDTESIAITFI